ncbi:BTB/POZ domain protein, partial [Opisthorchis viverrini]
MSDRATFPVAGAVCATNRVPRDRSTQYIDHSSDVAASISNLYGNELFSDVTLVVQGVQFTAHKVVLAARSEYFRALLYGGLAESNRSVIQLNDINAAAFKHVLQYIYTGRLTVTKLRTMLDVLGLAHQYDFRSLESALSAHLTHSLRLSNVWLIYNLAVMYGLEELINACLKFLDGIAPAPLFSPHFLRLSQ